MSQDPCCPHCGGEVLELSETVGTGWETSTHPTGKWACQTCCTMFSGAPPKKAQHQGSLSDQLDELARIATKQGLYDAADWILSHRRPKEAHSSQTAVRAASLKDASKLLVQVGELLAAVKDLVAISKENGFDVPDFVKVRLVEIRLRIESFEKNFLKTRDKD